MEVSFLWKWLTNLCGLWLTNASDTVWQSFLCDYGLLWVGSRDTRETDECEQTHSSDRLWRLPGRLDIKVWCAHIQYLYINNLFSTEKSLNRRFCMNFDLVLQRMRELNILAGEGETYIQTTTRGAQLAQKKSIQLRLYRNGIVVFNGPFRSYQEQRTQVSSKILNWKPEYCKLKTVWMVTLLCLLFLQQFMQDLMDGYFPSELQEMFPDGVPFEVCLTFHLSVSKCENVLL